MILNFQHSFSKNQSHLEGADYLDLSFLGNKCILELYNIMGSPLTNSLSRSFNHAIFSFSPCKVQSSHKLLIKIHPTSGVESIWPLEFRRH